VLHKIKKIQNYQLKVAIVYFWDEGNVTSELIFKTKYLRQKDIEFSVFVNKAI
jgi:hypothetical protein